MNAHRGFTVLRRHQTGVDGERADGDQHVAAGRFGIDELFVDLHLREKIIDVGVRTFGFADHRDLAGHRVRAADAVDLDFMG